MELPVSGWKNKNGTAHRNCTCGSWKQHWMNFSNKKWPIVCTVNDCLNAATLGAHVINSSHNNEYIVPMCESCNKLSSEFSLKDGTICVSANISETCDK